MKPLKLTMNAFGSYADVQTLDFTKVGVNGLYLITGETGSGKTTIFDAVAYALFGKASGAARNNYKMLRSDYAQGRTKTFVEFEFSSRGDVYTIRREIVPHIARKTEEVTYTDNVSLILPDQTVIDRSRDVSAKISEVVGLDRDQFSQIIMIAQNDFLRFLQSSTDDRVKILRRIFNTAPLKQFQDRLKAKAKEKVDARKSVLSDFERHNVDPYRREEQFALWEKQITGDEEKVRAADDLLEKYDGIAKELAGKIAVADDLNGKFDQLAVHQAALEVHEAKADEMAALDGRRKRGEAALRQVKPFADKADEAKQEYLTAKSNLDTAKKDAQSAEEAFEIAKKTIAELPPIDEVQNAFNELNRKCEQETEKLSKLKALKIDYDGISAKQADFDAILVELSRIEEEMKSMPSLEESKAAFDKLTRDLEQASERHVALTGLKTDSDAISDRQASLAVMQAECESLNISYKEVKDKYDTLYEQFILGQAGIIAKGLIDNEPCPVCGSTEHPAPASFSNEEVSEANLEKARTAMDRAKQKVDDKSAECGKLLAEVETLSKRFISDLSKHIPDAVDAVAEELLAVAIAETQALSIELAEKKAIEEKALNQLDQKIQLNAKRQVELEPECTKLKADISARKELFFKEYTETSADVTWEGAGETLAVLLLETQAVADSLTSQKESDEKALAKLKADRETAEKELADCQIALSKMQTLVVERTEMELERLRLCNGAEEEYKTAIAANGFTDENDYEAALVDESELSEITKIFTDYIDLEKQLSRDIERLKTETEGKLRPDLEKLKSDADEIKIKIDELRGEREGTNGRLADMKRLLAELRESAEHLSKVEEEYAEIKQLSETANGKLDFETYAQMAYFERVLHAANRRLKVMSQNRYTLLRREESDDGRKRMGLEIEVTDSFTGKSRSANSLSGGESFMASLSLALGLSDVVQQNAGGIHLDAMFIDEGFGSLDAEVLELAVRTLADMAGGNRIIGIISHVAELRERIDKQIIVEKTSVGSKISILI